MKRESLYGFAFVFLVWRRPYHVIANQPHQPNVSGHRDMQNLTSIDAHIMCNEKTTGQDMYLVMVVIIMM